MRKLLHCFFFMLTFSAQSMLWAQDGRKQETVQKEQPQSTIVLTVSADNLVRVQNAEPGSQMEVYNIVGVKLTTIRINSTDETVQVNLSKGYYIFKIGNVVRKVVIK
ncbi:T9SS type A sorting domain-containing protein [Bacteroides sp. UBA939]|uniref:T9SS type A sorting domain-containing protein n=1 Tax=Bacteroides sp. UBA939 TaxID=1946092 RepID=UPI0025C306EF|nr:T9SS type A sorting domain-containing protein [Bacteroides sp. UBA939]